MSDRLYAILERRAAGVSPLMKPEAKICPTPLLAAVPSGPRVERMAALAPVKMLRASCVWRTDQRAARWALRLNDLYGSALLVLLLTPLV